MSNEFLGDVLINGQIFCTGGPGRERGIDLDGDSTTITANSYEPIISIRLAAGSLTERVQILHYYMVGLSSDRLNIRLIKNPTLVGAVWQAITDSPVEFERDAASLTDSDDIVQTIGYSNQTRQATGVLRNTYLTETGGTADIYTVCAKSESSNATGFGGINWIEQE